MGVGYPTRVHLNNRPRAPSLLYVVHRSAICAKKRLCTGFVAYMWLLLGCTPGPRITHGHQYITSPIQTSYHTLPGASTCTQHRVNVRTHASSCTCPRRTRARAGSHGFSSPILRAETTGIDRPDGTSTITLSISLPTFFTYSYNSRDVKWPKKIGTKGVLCTKKVLSFFLADAFGAS
jgi:hypothetical protein